MRKFIKAFFLLLILLCTIHFAHGQDIEKKFDVSFSAGQQKEDFHWSIAGNTDGQSPNVLSELKWKNVSGTSYTGTLQWNIWKAVLLYADYNRVEVHSGAVNDMDYHGDNRTAPIYTGNFSDNKGFTSAWKLGAGYMIFNNKLFSVIPYVGYSYSTQSLYLVDLTGQFPTLNSTYQAFWKGEFVKVKASLKIIPKLKVTADITYNQVNYTAKGDWNLINEFQHPLSYSHVADGYGINTGAGLVYTVIPHLAVHFGYSYFNWQTGKGTDQLYLATGEVDKTRLNGVFRNGFQIAGGVNLFLW